MSNDKYDTDKYVYLRICDKRNKFYIVPDDFRLIADGIVGLPMLENYRYKVTNDQIQLNDHVFVFQPPQVISAGQIRVETIYLDKRPTQVCFCNTGEQPIQTSYDLSNEDDLEQIQKFKHIIRTSHIANNFRIPIEKFLLHYIDVFNLDTDTLPCTDLTKHIIALKENKILNTESYRPHTDILQTAAHKLEIEKQINEMLNKSIIEESVSTYNRPVWSPQ